MSEPDHYNLYRKLRVAAKNDDDLFHIRYTLTDDRHAEDTDARHTETSRERIPRVIKPPPDSHRIAPHKFQQRKGSEDVKESGKESSARPKPKHKYELKKEHKE
jgi:hypothetical protein